MSKKMPKGKVGTEKQPSALYSWYVTIVLMFCLTVAFIDRQILSLLVGPIKADLGVSDTAIGLLAGFAFAVFYSVLGIPIARLSDKYNRRKIIAVGIFLWSLMTAACGLAKTYWVLFATRAGVGVGEATISPAAYSILSDYFPPDKLARAIGVYTTGLYMGAGLAMLGGSSIVQMTVALGTIELPVIGALAPWQMAFILASIPGFIALALMATVREPVRKEYHANGAITEAGKETVLWAEVFGFLAGRWQFFLALTLGSAAIGTITTAYLVWTPEFFHRTYGWSIIDAGFMFGVILLICGTTGPFAGGWFASYLSRRKIRSAEMLAILVGTIVILPLAIAMPLMADARTAVILLAPLTFALSFTQGLPPTMIQLVAPNRMRAQITAAFMLVAVLTGYTAGGILVALITDFVFQSEQALRYSLAIVSAVLAPAGLISFAIGLRHFAKLRVTAP